MGKLITSAITFVYSRSLDAVTTARTRHEREFDPEVVRQVKEASAHDITIGGSELAAQAIRAGLVDEFHHFVSPVVVDGGTRWLPDGLRLDLKLVDEDRFSNGVITCATDRPADRSAPGMRGGAISNRVAAAWAVHTIDGPRPAAHPRIVTC